VDCDELVRAGRVAVRDGSSPDAALADNRSRAELEHARYRAVYGIDLTDRSTYDLVLDSTSTAPDGLAEAIIGAARSTFA
jgi:cytidylate kinase